MNQPKSFINSLGYNTSVNIEKVGASFQIMTLLKVYIETAFIWRCMPENAMTIQ